MQIILPAALLLSGITPLFINSLAASRAHKNWPVRFMLMTVVKRLLKLLLMFHMPYNKSLLLILQMHKM